MTRNNMFYGEPDPPRAQGVEVAEGILRIVANNPGKMTYHGTNSYIIDTPVHISKLSSRTWEPTQPEFS